MRDGQVAGALAAYVCAAHEPTPAGLAEVTGRAAEATGCALTIAGERYLWGEDTGPWHEHAITCHGEELGVVALASDAGPASEAAVALGPLLAMLRLAAETDTLRRAGDAAARRLIDDRWRAAAEMEEERRRLERDLHDGAQHHLVALRMSLGLLEHAITTGGVAERVTDLLARVDSADRVLVDTAAGVLPVALVNGGLAAALTEELANHAEVTLDLAGLRQRYPAVVESTVYFVCLEGVNNARKHAPGAHVTVTVADSYRGLEFHVSDNGPGFDMTAAGSGLHNLAERAGAVGGVVDVTSAPGQGTEITGFVPL
jgi:signal transduction histidine kinase